MNESLSVADALILIDFISGTNYRLAQHGDGLFSSKQEAITHVNSCLYNPEETLNVCFDTKQGNYWESAQVFYSDSQWSIVDIGMGGLSSSGKSIKEALESFRLKHDATCDYYPVKLKITNENEIEK